LRQQVKEAQAADVMAASLSNGFKKASVNIPGVLNAGGTMVSIPQVSSIPSLGSVGTSAGLLQLAKTALSGSLGKIGLGMGIAGTVGYAGRVLEQKTGWNIPGIGYSAAELKALGYRGGKHRRAAFINKRGMKVIRRANAIKKQVRKAANMLGLFKRSARGKTAMHTEYLPVVMR